MESSEATSCNARAWRSVSRLATETTQAAANTVVRATTITELFVRSAAVRPDYKNELGLRRGRSHDFIVLQKSA